jgi:hypothetical protein
MGPVQPEIRAKEKRQQLFDLGKNVLKVGKGTKEALAGRRE